jgi:hypothetical protein
MAMGPPGEGWGASEWRAVDYNYSREDVVIYKLACLNYKDFPAVPSPSTTTRHIDHDNVPKGLCIKNSSHPVET